MKHEKQTQTVTTTDNRIYLTGEDIIKQLSMLGIGIPLGARIYVHVPPRSGGGFKFDIDEEDPLVVEWTTRETK